MFESKKSLAKLSYMTSWADVRNIDMIDLLDSSFAGDLFLTFCKSFDSDFQGA